MTLINPTCTLHSHSNANNFHVAIHLLEAVNDLVVSIIEKPTRLNSLVSAVTKCKHSSLFCRWFHVTRFVSKKETNVVTIERMLIKFNFMLNYMTTDSFDKIFILVLKISLV